jgi:hypothetical protein
LRQAVDHLLLRLFKGEIVGELHLHVRQAEQADGADRVMCGRPESCTSMGMVTLRSISSADMPEDCVMISTIGGTGSG